MADGRENDRRRISFMVTFTFRIPREHVRSSKDVEGQMSHVGHESEIFRVVPGASGIMGDVSRCRCRCHAR